MDEGRAPTSSSWAVASLGWPAPSCWPARTGSGSRCSTSLAIISSSRCSTRWRPPTSPPETCPSTWSTSSPGTRTSPFVRRTSGAAPPASSLEIPPFLFGPVVKNLAEADLVRNGRIVVEKPFGHDLASARELADEMHQYVDEAQLFRIDHVERLLRRSHRRLLWCRQLGCGAANSAKLLLRSATDRRKRPGPQPGARVPRGRTHHSHDRRAWISSADTTA
jgi:hypothetical protein